MKISLFDAISMLAALRKVVCQQTISNCFWSAQFLEIQENLNKDNWKERYVSDILWTFFERKTKCIRTIPKHCINLSKAFMK
jgi:hypothetical protein